MDVRTHMETIRSTAGQIPRGVADYFWDEAYRRRELEHTLLAFFRTWGYGDVIPPSFEYADTLSARGSGELQSEMCRFLDRDGSMLALRADMTIPVARLVATRLHDCALPQRFCYAGSVFRDVEPRAGQQREFWQAGVELIGSAAPDADAEVLALTARALEEAGIDEFRIVVGQMQYFDGLLQALQLAPAERARLQAAVDRNSEAELDAFLRDASLPRRQHHALVELPQLSGHQITSILARADKLCLNEIMHAAVRNLHAISAILAAYGVLDHVALDLTEIHNLGYYTGITFEALAPGVGFRLASGGRYDNLIGTFGAPSRQSAWRLGWSACSWRNTHSAGGRTAPQPVAPDLLASTGNDPQVMALVEIGRELGLHIAVDLQHRHGQPLWEAAQQMGIRRVLDWQPETYTLYEFVPGSAYPTADHFSREEITRRIFVLAEELWAGEPMETARGGAA